MSTTVPEPKLAARADGRERSGASAAAAATATYATTTRPSRAPARRPRVRIVSDCSTFKPPFTAGGTERQLSDLAGQLQRDGVDIAVIARECPDNCLPSALDSSDSTEEAPSAPRTTYVAPAPVPKGLGWAALGPNLRYIARTFGLLLRTRREYDVLIVSGFRQLALPVAVLARLVRKRCILRVEASWDLDDELTPESSARIGRAASYLLTALIRLSRSLAFRLAHRVVAFSDPLARRLLELGAPAKKVEQIPNGIDTRRFVPVGPAEKAALRARLGLPAGRPIFIYTGRICRAKGLRELLRIWERLARDDDAYLLLIGSGAASHESCEPEVREMIARHPGAIDWRGEVHNVAQYLQAADVFIFLSYYEACSLSLLEAAAVGLPCLVTDVGCALEIVRHHESGAIVPARAQAETVLREIEWLRSRQQSWPAMGAAVRSRVVGGYGLQSVAARYGRLCGGGRHRGVT